MTIVPWINGIQDIADNYDAFFVDAWGVLHDGISPYAGAIDALRQLRRARKDVVIVSNAPRRNAVVAKEMAALGIGSDLYTHVITSGEATWQALSARQDAHHAALDTRCFYVGQPRSRSIMDGLELQEVDRIEDASFFLVTGVAEPDGVPETFDTLGAYDQVLATAQARDLVLVCANSDRIAISGGKSYFCGGALAARYEKLGGTCLHYGKPHSAIYDTCIAALNGISPANVLAVGDSFETDIPGAHNANIDALFISGGIHATSLTDNPSEGLKSLCDDTGCRPKAAMTLLRW